MRTRCPECQTIFRVGPEQLGAAGGRVRCGTCRHVFDAKAHAVTGNERKDNKEPASTQKQTQPRLPSGIPAPAVSKTDVDLLAPFPAIAKPRRTGPLWWVLNLMLLLLLAGQVLIGARDRLGQGPLRPVVASLCQIADCVIAEPRDLAAFEVTTRSVQSHPQFERSLLVDLAFVNHATFAQPYPDLVLRFYDTDEHTIAERQFTPAEYLGAQPPNAMAAEGEVRATLGIVDPGERAFGFEFEFR